MDAESDEWSDQDSEESEEAPAEPKWRRLRRECSTEEILKLKKKWKSK